MSARYYWRTPAPSKIDRALAANGTHSRPKVKQFVSHDTGAVLATASCQNGGWRYTTAGGFVSGVFPNELLCKVAARERALKEAT